MHPSDPAFEQVTQLPVLPPRPGGQQQGHLWPRAGHQRQPRHVGGRHPVRQRGPAGRRRPGAVAVPMEILPIVAAGNPCYMTAPLAQDEHGRLCRQRRGGTADLGPGNNVVAMGPGLGRSPAITALVSAVLSQFRGRWSSMRMASMPCTPMACAGMPGRWS